MTQLLIPEAHELLLITEKYLQSDEQKLLLKAYDLARREHGEERRRSGELFITHPVTVARYLADYQADVAALSAALLHDVAEDADVSVEEIRRQFGEEVARLVDGLTKFEAVTEGVSGPRLSKEQVQAATLHKLFRVMTADFRVGIIKLFDRLHNMQTIGATPIESQRRKAKETLAVYAPLANRLGMWNLRNELGALALSVLHAEAFGTISQRLEQIHHQQQVDFYQISRQIIDELKRHDLTVDVQQSSESIYSVFDNARINGQLRYQVDDTLRLVVELPSVQDCYLALGYIHSLWPPVPHKFDDYVARPRDNLYSALHTTVNHPSGQWVKVRFRTRAMNVLSEIGIMARWVHFGMPLWSRELAVRVEAFSSVIRENILMEPQNPGEGVQGVVEDVFRRQILVYTPLGDVKQLRQGATPVDFAYSIHTDVGHRCYSAEVNGQRYALNRPLQDGDRVFIVKREVHHPERIWLDEDLGYTQTRYARTHVRRWFRRLTEATAVVEGGQLLNRELQMIGLPDYNHQQVAELFGYEQLREFYFDLGRAEILPTAVSTRVLAQNWDRIPARSVGREMVTSEGGRYIVTNAGGRHLHWCRICQPYPGDPVLGYIRSDDRVTVHNENCVKLPSDPLSDRTLRLSWGEDGINQVRLVTVYVDVYDRPNLVWEIASFLRDEKINIHTITTVKSIRGKSIVLKLEVVTPRQVMRILHRVHALVNVYDVHCLPFTEDQDGANSPFYLPE